jgi:predicted PurR-regulated permease PerM
LPAPLLFGALMAFLAVFPIIGTPLVWIPGSVYLFYSGDWKGALILFIWGAVIVSLIDNLIRPLIVSEGSKIHILIIFIGVVGGLTAWGFIGLFLGPLVVSLFMFMLDNYRKEWKNNYIEAIHNNSNHDTEERDK